MTFNRTIITACICFIALANAQCARDRRGNGTESSTLTIHVANGDERGERIPRLAKSWEHSDDYRTWTFRLRSDVKWHDGAPVTAHDVAFTFDLLRGLVIIN